MDFTLRTLFDLLIYGYVLNYLLVLAGVWAVLCWSIDNFRSVLEITKSVLTPYFQPQENKSLVEKYGKWAGEKINFFHVYWMTRLVDFYKNDFHLLII